MNPVALASQAGKVGRCAPAGVSGQPEHEYRFVDDEGNEYRYCVDSQGGAIVSALAAVQERVCIPAQMSGRKVVAIGAGACSSSDVFTRWGAIGTGADAGAMPPVAFGALGTRRNAALVEVVVPDGVEEIGRGAFRGCTRLTSVALPDSLQSIGDYAFSCTGIKSLHLPAACTHLAPLALRLGPESLVERDSWFSSKLERVDVDAGSRSLGMVGEVLCRRIDGTQGLEALLCPARAESVALSDPIGRIADGAFAGTSYIAHLVVRDGIGLAPRNGLVAGSACGRMTIERGNSADVRWEDASAIELAFPNGAHATLALRATCGKERFCAAEFLRCYDESLLGVSDRLEQAKLMLARLARPIMLDGDVAERFRGVLAPELDTLCAHFGARAYWEGFDCMVESGLLDEEGIGRAVAVLTACSDAPATAYLLKLKRERFTPTGWDYEL